MLARLRTMTQRNLFSVGRNGASASVDLLAEPEAVSPAGQSRQESIQRLQVGVFGIAAMLLLVGLASIIGSQADMTQEAAVPEAAPTTEPTATPTQANPLADAGVVPDIAADPSPTPAVPLDVPPPNQAPGDASSPQ